MHDPKLTPPLALEPGDRLLTDPEAARISGVGTTTFRSWQDDPDFDAVLWLGPRLKRISERRLVAYIGRRAARTVPGTAEARRIRNARPLSHAQSGFASVTTLLLLSMAALVALFAVSSAAPYVAALVAAGMPALAMLPPVGIGRILENDEGSNPVADALAGERAALRVLRRIADNVGHGDELLGELRDVVHDDGGNVEATPRLRAFARTLQKALEQRP